MPSIESNRKIWGESYPWTENGDEWSEPWGNTKSQWYGCIFPRIHAFIPTNNILEIAPGFGRWTQYLKDHCKTLEIVDLNSNCIAKCQERFAGFSHLNYHVNDGNSLDMISNDSIDFAFSFDSLVHAELPVLESYLKELAKKLTQDGVGFFHHSNLGEYEKRWRLKNEIPPEIKRYLPKNDRLMPHHWRSFSVTATNFSEACDLAGLSCISQELVNWNHRLLTDAFSTFTRKGSKWDRPNRKIRNRKFMDEAKQISELSNLYSFSQ